MAQLRKPSLLLLTGLCLGFSLATGLSAVYADPALTPDDKISFGDDASSQSGQKSAEKKTVHGHRSLPPGYQDAPSMEFNHGADPDHLAKVHRDAVTGSDLSRYGSAYESSGPYGSGQMGDATGNGWVTPR